MTIGSILRRLRHLYRVHVKYSRRPRRYRQVLQAVVQRQPTSIVEVGVYQGKRAVEMIEAAALSRPPEEIKYYGFDLFEGMSREIHSAELSKWPDSEEQILNKLKKTGAQISLFKGFTDITLPEFVKLQASETIDFAFVDGGHAVETIKSDWDNISKLCESETLVLFDDFYVDCPERTKKFGCNAVMETLNAGMTSLKVLPIVDSFVHDDGPLRVAVAQVSFRR